MLINTPSARLQSHSKGGYHCPGPSGLAFIREALRQFGSNICAYVRSPDKIPEELRSRIRVVQGGLTDEDRLGEALEGADIVVSFLVSHTLYRGTRAAWTDSIVNRHRVFICDFLGVLQLAL